MCVIGQDSSSLRITCQLLARLRVGHVHLTLNEVVPLRNTNGSYAWLVRAGWLATASHGAALWGKCAQHSPHPRDYAPEAAPQAEG